MRILVTILNIVISIYFFVLANFYFWGGVLVFFATIFGKLEESKDPFVSLILLLFTPFLITACIFFLRKSSTKYVLGLVLLLIMFLEGEIYRFFFVTHGKLESTELSNLAFFGIPFAVIYLTKLLDKKYLVDMQKRLDLHPPLPSKS